MEEPSVSVVEDGTFSVMIEVPDAGLIDTNDEQSTSPIGGDGIEDGPVHSGGGDDSTVSVKVQVSHGKDSILKEDVQEGAGVVNHQSSAPSVVIGGGDGWSEPVSEYRFSQQLAEFAGMISTIENGLRSSASNNGDANSKNTLTPRVSTQDKQCHLSIIESNQNKKGMHSKLGRKNSETKVAMLAGEKGELQRNEVMIVENRQDSYNDDSNFIDAYKCQLCDRVFASQGELHTHVKAHIGKDLEGRLVAESTLMVGERLTTAAKPFKCDSCEKSYAYEKTLKRHQRLHSGEKQFRCQYCEKIFLQKSHVIRHERIHTGEKPFECKYCQKKFSQKASLMGHEKVHTGNKSFMCRFCQKRFAQKINLTRHERIHTGEKPFHCKYCDKSFVQESNLICHELVHTNEKQFKCSYCENTFARKCDLIQHERVHARERPILQGFFCEEKLPQSSEVIGHERMHTGERLFK